MKEEIVAVKQIGLEAIFNIAQFKAGADQYIQLNQTIRDVTISTASGISKAGVGTIALGNILADIAIGAGKMFVNVMREAVSAVVELGVKAIKTSSRVGELEAILRALGQLWGIQQEEIDGIVRAMEEHNIQMDVARKTVIEFIRGQWELTKATELATAARDLATISGLETSDALTRLTYGIRTLNTRMLRNAGAAVNLQTEYARWARANDRTSASLQPLEKQQIALNAVLREGQRVSGAYWAAMQEGSKVARSTGRALFDLWVLIGKPFREAYWRATQTIYDFVLAMQVAAREGGAWFDSLRKWGALLTVVFEEIQKLASQVMPTVIQFGKDFSDTFWDLAAEALEWGVNIAVNIADGLITGAEIAITGAMNFITTLLTDWLGPGSPPKVAPDLVAWGAAAMAEWLHGMTLADFGILTDIQGPLRGIFRVFESLGKIAADEIGPAFRDLSAIMIEAFSKAGKLGQEAFDAIREATGEFAEDIILLIERHDELQAAIQRVEDAQRSLDEAMEAQVESADTVRRLTDEYNALMRAGASRDVLKAKLAELNVAEKQFEVATAQRKESKEALKDAKKQVDPLEEQFRVQQAILSQLVKIAEALIPPRERAARKKKKGLPAIPVIVIPEPLTGDFKKAIDQAFEDLKESIRARLEKAFAPIVKRWEEDWAPAIERIKAAWATFTTFVGEKANELRERLQPVIDNFRAFWAGFGKELPEIIGPVIQSFLSLLSTQLSSILDLALKALIRFSQWFAENEPLITEATRNIGAVLTFVFDAIRLIFEGLWPIIEKTASILWDVLLWTVQRVLEIMAGEWDAFGAAFAALWLRVEEHLNTAVVWIYKQLIKIAGFFYNLRMDIEGHIETAFSNLFTIIAGWIGETLTFFTKKIPEFVRAGKDMMQGMIDGIASKAQALINKAKGVVNDAIQAAKNLLGMKSPSSVFKDIGADIMKGARLGVESAAAEFQNAIGSAFSRYADFGTPATSLPTAAYTTTNQYTIQIDMSGMAISNGMDEAVWAERVKQVINETITR